MVSLAITHVLYKHRVVAVIDKLMLKSKGSRAQIKITTIVT